jgi:hypothetical protein
MLELQIVFIRPSFKNCFFCGNLTDSTKSADCIFFSTDSKFFFLLFIHIHFLRFLSDWYFSDVLVTLTLVFHCKLLKRLHNHHKSEMASEQFCKEHWLCQLRGFNTRPDIFFLNNLRQCFPVSVLKNKNLSFYKYFLSKPHLPFT